jgi:hypothetical protein
MAELLTTHNIPSPLVTMVGKVLSHVVMDPKIQINLVQAPSLASAMENLGPKAVIVSDLDGPATDFGKMSERILSDFYSYDEPPGVNPEDVIPEWERIKECSQGVKDSTFIVTTRPSEDEKIELEMQSGQGMSFGRKAVDFIKAVPAIIYRGTFQTLWKDINGFDPVEEFKKIGINNMSYEPNRRNPKSEEFQASVKKFLQNHKDAETINFVFDVLTVDSIARDFATLVAGASKKERFDEYHSEIVAIKSIMAAAKELNIDVKRLNIILTNRTLFKEMKSIGTMSQN